MNPGERARICAVDIDDRGFGVGHADTRPGGLSICAPDLLPGEHAEVEVEHVSPHQARAWARIIRRLGAPAPERVDPPCPAFGRCGGCLWQHLSYDAQLVHKQRRVHDALREHGLPGPVEPPIAAPRTMRYRNKGKYVAGLNAQGLVLGAYAPRTHVVVDTTACQIVEPPIARVARHAREVLARSPLPPYDERARAGLLRYVIIRAGCDGQVLVGLITTTRATRALMTQAAAAVAEHPEVAGVVWMRNDATNSVLLSDDSVCLAGRATVTEQLAGVDIELGLEDFFQVNREQAERLYAEAARETTAGKGPGLLAVDLFCGVGGIAFALARTGAQVLGVEVVPSAVQAARDAAARAGLGDRVRFQVGDAAHLPRIASTSRIDVVVVNPPRKGLSPETRAALVALAPPTIVYVSCGPASLARDLAELSGAGWRVERVAPIDLMPGTPQIETLVTLERSHERG